MLVQEEIERLESELSAINQQRDALASQAKELAKRIATLQAKQSALDMFSRLSEGEKAELAQVLAAHSIPSAEQFGQPSS